MIFLSKKVLTTFFVNDIFVVTIIIVNMQIKSVTTTRKVVRHTYVKGEYEMEEKMMGAVQSEFVPSNAQVYDPVKEMKKAATKIGWKYSLFAIVTFVVDLIYALLLPEQHTQKDWAQFLGVIISIYIVGFPVLLLLTMKMPKVKLEKKKLGFWKFVLCVFINAGLCFIGMMVGLVMETSITLPFSLHPVEAEGMDLATLMISSGFFWRVFTVGICAPIVEELIFRKLLIDRVVKHGEWLAILLSGIMFGLFHGNFRQAVFATLIGMFWAFIYIRTGKVWYTIAMHMVINLTTSVVTVGLCQFMLKYMDYAADPNVTEQMMRGDINAILSVVSTFLVLGWLLFLGTFALVGVILFFVYVAKICRNIKCSPQGVNAANSLGYGLLNWGMIGFWLLCIFKFVLAYGPLVVSWVKYLIS